MGKLDPGSVEAGMAAAIVRSADRASQLTRQLLGFTRRQPASPVALDLGAAVLELEPVLQRLFRAEVDLRVDAQPTEPVDADPAEVEQIVLNLAVNARDALGERGGRVDVLVDAAVVGGSAAPRPMVRLRVVDDGAGMTEEVRARCLEPFFTTKGRHQGTGLGLAAVHGIAAERQGTLLIDSAPGEGTTVTVLLPPAAEVPAPPHAARKAGAASWDGTGTVLLVEDEDDLRALAAAALRGAGLEVLEATDASQAVEIYLDRSFDVLVTDVVMPGMRGPDLAAAIVAAEPEVQVLLTTGYADVPVAGFPVLRKPYRSEEVVERVRALLAERYGTKR
jgi:CheY-like chemotaxis protein